MRPFKLEARARPTQGEAAVGGGAETALPAAGVVKESHLLLEEVAVPLRGQRDPDLPVALLGGAAPCIPEVGELAWGAGLVPEMEQFGQSTNNWGDATGGDRLGAGGTGRPQV